MRQLAAFLFVFGAMIFAAPSLSQQQAAPGQPTAPPPVKEDATLAPSPSPKPTPSETPGPPYGNFHWRSIGPAAPGGRVAAVAGSNTDPNLYFIGAGGGGVWKSTDGAETWSPVFEKEKVSSIGAVAIDQRDNNVVWVGTGESNPRNNVSYGDGVYKSTDGGKTWKNVGVPSRHISRILIDPRNSNHVIVGALGDVFGDSVERGVYVTFDGGATWSKTLYLSQTSGAADLAMNLQNPNVIYAGMWHFRRQPWTFTSGGADDGLFRSSDGGRTWTQLQGHGLPDGTLGRIGLAVAASDGNRVYATIEASKGILWRSDDGGANWTLVSSDTVVNQRPFYFSHLEVDTKNPNKLYAISNLLALSNDGGKNWRPIARDVHVDYHAMWIALNDPSRIMVGEDGGIARTVDGGDHWMFGRNLPIGQIYHVSASTHENPYYVCGGWQDNSGWCGPSNSLDPSGILNRYWIQLNGGDGMWAVPDPIDPNWIWNDTQVGVISLYNKKTKDSYNILAYLQTNLESFDLSTSKYRFNWDSPIAFAPWDGHVAWLGGNVVFQTTDRGHHWKPISPDLTLNIKAHQKPSGGPITKDVSGAEYSDNILDIEGSSLRKGEIWVATDDGLVQLSRDFGKHWRNVTPPGVPPYGRVETAAPSTTNAGTVFVNIDRHRSGDFKPYLFVSHDWGRSWQSITAGLPADQYVRTVRPDLHNAAIVYAGTENGIWLSRDGGAHWVDFKNNMPTVSVRDIRFQAEFNDILVATHGRSFYVLDDATPLQQLSAATSRGYMLFPVRTAYEYNLHSDDEGIYTDYSGQNPPYGATITFYQDKIGSSPPVIQILNAQHRVIRTVQGNHRANFPGAPLQPWVTNHYGVNRFTWDFQVDGPVLWKGAAKPYFQGPEEGATVPPGRYYARMTLGGHTFTQGFDVKADPLTVLSQRELENAYEFVNRYNRYLSVIDTMLNNLDTLKSAFDADAVSDKAEHNSELQHQITAAQAARQRVFDELTANFQNGEDSIQRPGKIREDIGGVAFGQQPVLAFMKDYDRRVMPEYLRGVKDYNAFVATLNSLNSALKSAGLKTVDTKSVSP